MARKHKPKYKGRPAKWDAKVSRVDLPNARKTPQILPPMDDALGALLAIQVSRVRQDSYRDRAAGPGA